MIKGGRATNIVPETCVVNGEVRSLSHEKALITAESVRAIFESEAAAIGATVEFASVIQALAYATPLDHPVIARFDKACRSLGLNPVLAETFGGSDNNSLAQRAITGIVIANAMDQCHSCAEYSTIAGLTSIAELTLTLMTACD